MFFSSSDKENRSLVCTILEGSFELSLVTLGEKTVVHSFEQREFRGDSGAFPVAEIRDGLSAFVAYHKLVPKSVAFVLGVPYAFAQARHLQKKFPTPTLLTDRAFEAILEADNAHIEQSVMVDHPRELAVISRTISHVRLDGYEVESFIGKKVRAIELDMTVAYIDKSVYDALDTLSQKLFPKSTVSYFARPLALARSLGRVHNKQDALVVAPDMDATDILLLEKGVLAESISVPFGARHLRERAMHALGVLPHEWSTLFHLFHLNDLTGAEMKRVGAAHEKAQNAWLAALAKEWEPVRAQYHLPTTLFILAEEGITRFLGAALESKSLRRVLRERGDFVTHALDASYLVPKHLTLDRGTKQSLAQAYLIPGLFEVMHSLEKTL